MMRLSWAKKVKRTPWRPALDELGEMPRLDVNPHVSHLMHLGVSLAAQLAS